jgi:hypothetical protein
VRGLVLSWNPEQNVAIVAGACEHFPCRMLFIIFVD